MDTRLPPPQGPPPSYAFVTKVYKSTLRPVVLFTTTVGAFWAIVSSISYFRNYGVDRIHSVPRLALFTIVLGAIYMGVFVIELYGALSAMSNRTHFVRPYAYLSIVSALAVVAATLLDVVTHFMLKNDIINICSDLTNGDDLVYYGFFGPVYHQVINAAEARSYCSDSWNHDSWSTIITFLITSLLAVLFSFIAFGYLHQLMDPTSPVNSARAPSYQVRAQGYPSYYNPPYNTSYHGPYDGQSYNAYYTASHANYPGPPPPIPERDEPFVPPDDAKPPSYSGDPVAFGVHGDKDDPFSVPESDVTSPGLRDRH